MIKRNFARLPALALACLMVLSTVGLALSPPDNVWEHDSDSGADDSGPRLLMNRAAVTINNISQLEPFFPDANFRAVVFKAVKGQSGSSVEDALAHFTGNINAKSKGIKNVNGLQLLRWANKVDLTSNLIEDLTVLSESGQFSRDYYAQDIESAVNFEDRDEGYNVYWVLDKNPFTQLPASFGGRLVIKQMATAALHYAPDDTRLFYLRDTAGQTFDYSLNIARCRIRGSSADNNFEPNGFVALSEPAHVMDTPALPNTAGAVIKAPSKADNKAVKVSLLTSGSFNVAVPVEKVVHYDTADEWNTITPGSQSFKYYIEQPVTVYDRLTMTHTGMAGTLNFTKTASDTGAPLAGAVYDLYKGPAIGTPITTGLTTDQNGKITVSGLDIGSYTLCETKAPAGYLLGGDVTFTIGKSAPKLVLSGGIQRPDPSVLADPANEDMVYFTGPNTPEITLAFKSGVSHELIDGEIKAIYSSLNGGAGDEVFYPNSDHTISDALALLSQRIADNSITGPVKFEVTYKGALPGGGNFSADVFQKDDPVPDDFAINVTKVWNDDNNAQNDRPASVTAKLLQNGLDTGKTLTLTGPGWAAAFSDLTAADGNGKLYRYSVKEAPVTNYDHVQVQGGQDVDALSHDKDATITNTHNEVPPPPPPSDFAISVAKAWNDDDNAQGDRPASVKVKLLQNGADIGKTLTLTSAAGWVGSFAGLKALDANGVAYSYTVQEIPVEKYSHVQVQGGQDITAQSADKSAAITNTHDTLPPPPPPPTPDEPFSIAVSKVWRADERYLTDRPASVTVSLLCNGAPTGDTRILSAPDWSASFDNLDPVDDNGARFSYTVKETAVPEYTTFVSGGAINAATADKRVVVTNTHETYSPSDGPSDEPPTPATPPSPPVTPPVTPPEVPTVPGQPITWEFPPDDNVTVEEPPEHGTVTHEPRGPLTYTPNEGYHGPDAFTVKTVDPSGNVRRYRLTVRVLSAYTANPSTGARI